MDVFMFVPSGNVAARRQVDSDAPHAKFAAFIDVP